ncbi:response regulator transcription factor [Corynebacterium guangdongense]|uniref:DNA-binding NarL/FixJ family response regulator n=1 Tax=Corynebacterium guangdongense TaxID=1783348 RepID=A0ABU2A048_9CORY|nr:response regulator transcription factor [Corynebacterium guangdongense]MDR7330557.1 DNA-binding NarL/FixJ family response regulator [Corynebacterium guangdongense]WJZ19111.1 Transcriptional regulatory protein LiaR [Corynebacterium guangdongense]
MISVALIDDHPVVRAGLRAILDSFDDVTVVADAGDGSVVDDLPEGVDVVVTDLQMPGVDGVEATRRLVAAHGPPVLVLTTFDTQADILNALEAGALGYLLKDAPEQALHDAVVATARGRRTLAPEVAAVLAERVTRPREALSARETEILAALASGASNRALATQMFISEATVKTHLVHIYQKLGVDNRTAAVTKARELKLI